MKLRLMPPSLEAKCIPQERHTQAIMWVSIDFSPLTDISIPSLARPPCY
jgi:hypothetical protein